MIDYMLEVEIREGHSRYYHDITSIEFYEKSIRAIDKYGVIMWMDIRDMKSVRIHAELLGDDEESKEAINHLKTVGKKAIDSGYDSDVVDAVAMAVNAINQKPILDKIRKIVDIWRADSWTDNISFDCMINIAKILNEAEAMEKNP